MPSKSVAVEIQLTDWSATYHRGPHPCGRAVDRKSLKVLGQNNWVCTREPGHGGLHCGHMHMQTDNFVVFSGGKALYWRLEYYNRYGEQL
jgi:hypothetical protein